MVFSQGVLAQLLAAETDEESSARTPSDNDDKTHLHYVCKEKLTEAYVDGTAVRAVCGVWFVPTLSDSANLPICCNCEQKKAAAQIIFDLTHRRFS
nr:DUF3039 domain-containing protein [Arcanobacterium phocae]